MTAYKEWYDDNESTLRENFVDAYEDLFEEFCLNEFDNYGRD